MRNGAGAESEPEQLKLEVRSLRSELNEPLLTPADGARLLAVKPSWVYEAVRTGAMPHVRVGKHIRFTSADIERWIEHQRSLGGYLLQQMGKGARIRAARAAEAARAATAARAREAVGALLELDSLPAYEALVRSCPELASDEAAEALREGAESPGYGALFARAKPLLDGARTGRMESAWATYRAASDEAEARGRELQEIDAEIERCRAERDHTGVLDLVSQALPVALEIGYGLVASNLLQQRGLALLNLQSPSRADELDAAIEAFDDALTLVPRGEAAAEILMHLGLVLVERVHGDPADNIDHGIDALRAALQELEGSEDSDLRPMIQTNLSVALGRRERGDAIADAREAAHLCRAALEVRDFDRSAEDWAYSTINLAEALTDLARAEHGDFADARACYEEVIRRGDALPDTNLVGVAHHALGRLDVAATQTDVDDLVDEYERTAKLVERPDEAGLLASARAHFEAAAELITADRIRHARVLRELGDVLAELGLEGEAIASIRESLTVLRPTTAPTSCRSAGWSLGHLLAERGDWEGAADAFRLAVEAAELAFHARLETKSREKEAQASGNLYRWAAYAIARAGDPRGAAVLLDAGRGRELGRRFRRDAPIRDVPSALRDEYRAAVETLAASSFGVDTANASRRLQEVVADIRRLPGCAHFGAGPQWTELTAAVEPRWPVVYVNPAPGGTLILGLWATPEDGVTAESSFVDATSQDVFMHLLVGGGPSAADVEESPPSYLFEISNAGGGLPDALDALLPWLGEQLARPVHEWLRSRDALGVTLVLCGPLGLAPFHAAPWHEADEAPQCLLDEHAVRYAPSAVVCANALLRQKNERAPCLVALADPHGDLPAAVPEVQEIARMFGPSAAHVATGPSANAAFLRRHGEHATHLHLACHARGGLFDTSDAAVCLTSEDIPATELTTVANLHARLVVASACQSALSEIAGLPDEVISIGTALLAAGSACAVATLWPVDDLATALLMIRLYEEMLLSDCRPPEALRVAQLWLRDLRADEEAAWLANHPSLAREFARRAASGRLPGRRTNQETDPGADTDGEITIVSERPYGHPDFWAPFVAVGV